MNNNDLNPQLKKHLDSLQDVPERGLQDSHASRENYLTQVRSLTPRPAVVTKNSRRRMTNGGRSWVSRFAAITAVIVVALSSLGGTVYAAQASGPDDLLYGVKTLTEEIQVSLESDPQDRLDLFASFASRRLQEIQAQVDAGEPVSDKALALLERHTERMLEEAAQMGGDGINQALLQIEQNLQKQNQMMAEMGKEHPQGEAPGLIKAQEKIRERLELVENGLKEPQGFRDKINNRNENAENPGQNNNPEDNPGQGEGEPGSPNSIGTPGNGNGNGTGGK